MSEMKLNAPLPTQGTQALRQGMAPTEEKRITASDNARLAANEASKEEKSGKTKQTLNAKPNAKELKQLTDELQRRVGGAGSQLEFSIDKESGESVVKVLDRQTKEVIRQIPSEEMLRIARGLDRYKEGLLIDSQA
ncbi:flagellar protein FlaG [Dechloromonas denitrificans]|uniref:flagellar protein FlaG n=1 Tax=Dechloromonas denitrificans TaxID=281362 RepID=UPI001CF8C25D|nr:flagellar protein FlaG [Dechloromonas denitrificans]UCV12727.1 flagellar protein FlaG [Dechloromonas denitrificans]